MSSIRYKWRRLVFFEDVKVLFDGRTKDLKFKEFDDCTS